MPISTSLRARHLLLASLIAGAVAPSVAQAQAIVGPADASRVQDRIARPQISQMANDLVSVEGPPVVAAPAGADKISLTLQAVNLEGATLYAPDALSAAYADKVGQKITVADVYKIAAEITRQYRNDGYILTQVVVRRRPLIMAMCACWWLRGSLAMSRLKAWIRRVSAS